MKILVINGPNLNFLGIRDRKIYGTQDYEYLGNLLKKKADELGIELEAWQSNHEGAIIDKLQEAYFEHESGRLDGIVINPGAYTHYSYAIRDALAPLDFPKYEVHISDIHSREDFRHVSVTLPECSKQIAGRGLEGYCMAMEEIVNLLKERKDD